MDVPELACRSRQEAFKWIECIQGAPRRRTQNSDPNALEHFIRNAKERFFKGAFEEQPASAEIIETADAICSGRFNLLGYRELSFGVPVDWHLDPISGKRAPLRHWSLLDPDDHAAIGDTKVICELNRHQWLVTLGQAYRSTRDERYANAVVEYLQSWLHDNPPGMGINWTSSLELALRLIAWTWALVLIRDSTALTPAFFAELLDSVQVQATHVERYMSYYFSPNTHLTGEALGLLYAGMFFDQPRWEALGRRVLLEEIERQVLDDGVYFERSTCYQRYTIDTYLHALILGVEVPAARVKSMLDFLVALRNGDGSMPCIGDADGGRLLPLTRSAADDFRATFSTAAVVFNEPKYAWAAGEFSPETRWLLGNVAQLQSAPQPADHVFRDGGYVVMRGGDHSLIFDTGALGCHYSSGHGHADLLSIQCSVFGEPYIVDPGMPCYGVNRELRDFFRGTAAHSSVRIDGRDQAEPAGAFAWRSRPSARLRHWSSYETIALADAEHDAYDPVSHRRRVIFQKRKFWIVVDDLTGAGDHEVELRFQFAPIQVHTDDKGWVRATRDGKRGLLLSSVALQPLCGEKRIGQIAPEYGRVVAAPAIVYTIATQLPLRIATILWPTEDVERETPDASELARKVLLEN